MQLKAKVIYIVVIILFMAGSGLYFWLKATGRLRTGAEAIIGCQSPRDITAFYGKPGSNLTSYNLFGHEISVHKYLPPFLDQIQKEVNAAKTGYNFVNVSSFNMRPKIWGGGQSLHSWGIAIDINPESNPYQQGNYGPPQSDIPIQIVNIFKKYGFAWGGDWPGERDSMHFEWYGASMSGQIINKVSNQKVLVTATDIDGAGSPNTNGDFSWIIPFGSHTITAKARGYYDVSFAVSLACYSDNTIDIGMLALPSNIAGSISGKVQVAGNYPLLMPSTIYLDSRAVAISTIRGDYLIPNVHEGKHKVEARVMFFPSGATVADLVPGENLKDVNVMIGK